MMTARRTGLDREIAWLRGALADTAEASPRTTLREQLGIHDNELAITPLVADASMVDARAALFHGGVIGMLGQPTAVLISSDSVNVAAMERLNAEVVVNARSILIPGPIAAAWPAVDVVFEIEVNGAGLDEPSEAIVQAWAERCGTRIARAKRLARPGRSTPALVDALWWAADLPDAIRNEPYA